MKSSVIRSFLFFVGPFIACGILSFLIFDKGCSSALKARANKPVVFTHKTHMTKHGIKSCQHCHGFNKDGRFKGIPTIGDCKVCHERTAFKEYKDTDSPWETFVRQPDLVYFSHLAVLKSAKTVPCTSCHNDKATSLLYDNMNDANYEIMANGKESAVKGKMTMGKCMKCHTKLKISNTCAVCHD